MLHLYYQASRLYSYNFNSASIVRAKPSRYGAGKPLKVYFLSPTRLLGISLLVLAENLEPLRPLQPLRVINHETLKRPLKVPRDLFKSVHSQTTITGSRRTY